MAYDLEEQEQIAELKAWWKKYGNFVIWTVIICLALYSAWMFWSNHQRKQAAQASILYYEMQNAVLGNDYQKALRIAQDTEDKFGGTVYASMNGLVAAKMAYNHKDLETAKAQLKWVSDKGKNDGYKALARIRLAGVLLDEKDYDGALKLLNYPVPAAFVSMAEDRKGDILLAQDKKAEAIAAWQKAFDKADPEDPGKQMIQLKLEQVGATPQTQKQS